MFHVFPPNQHRCVYLTYTDISTSMNHFLWHISYLVMMNSVTASATTSREMYHSIDVGTLNTSNIGCEMHILPGENGCTGCARLCKQRKCSMFGINTAECAICMRARQNPRSLPYTEAPPSNMYIRGMIYHVLFKF